MTDCEMITFKAGIAWGVQLMMTSHRTAHQLERAPRFETEKANKTMVSTNRQITDSNLYRKIR